MSDVFLINIYFLFNFNFFPLFICFTVYIIDHKKKITSKNKSVNKIVIKHEKIHIFLTKKFT